MLDNFSSIFLGRLTSSVDNKEINYQLFEVSHHAIGFIATADLEPGMWISFIPKDKAEKYNLLIVSTEPLQKDKYQKFLAIEQEGLINFEQICEEEMIRQRAVTPAGVENWHIRAIRFVTDPALVVDIKTFGMGRGYRVQTANISRTGVLLVSFDDKQKLPFKVNSLVEMTVRSNKHYESPEIKFMGKVARITGLDNNIKLQYVGTSFSEVEPQVLKNWLDLLEKIEIELRMRR